MSQEPPPTLAPDAETPDIESSTDEYANRFAGTAGKWMLDVQESLTCRLLKDFPPPRKVLDVGGGHGQLAFPLSRMGYDVTVLGSSPSCAHRVKDLLDGGECKFVVGNLVDIPFEANSFDLVVSFRIVTHCTSWNHLIGELCRVAREAVVVDYPTSESINRIAPWLFDAKKKMETNTRFWRSFRHTEIQHAFAENNWICADLEKQFFFPMVLHRMLKSAWLSRLLESCSQLLGLTKRWGSPVIAKFLPVNVAG